MPTKKSLVEVTHDDGYGDSLLMHINSAFGGKDMRADKIVNPVAPPMEIEGMPDGWEPGGIRQAEPGEPILDDMGSVAFYGGKNRSSRVFLVLRKIEKPKQYRPFVNAAEADQLWNAVLKYKDPDLEQEDTRLRITVVTSLTVVIGSEPYTHEEAFELFECIDGTPFGVEVVE